MNNNTIPHSEALKLAELISPIQHGIASRVLASKESGNLTLFAFDAGQGLSEHSAPFDALVMVLNGKLCLTIDGKEVEAIPGSLVRMPANRPHSVKALESTNMLLIMFKSA